MNVKADNLTSRSYYFLLFLVSVVISFPSFLSQIMKFLGFDKSQVNTIEAKEFLSLLLLFRKNLTLLLKNKFNQIFNCVWLVTWKPFVLWIFRGQSNGTSFPKRLPPFKTNLSGGYKRQKLIFHRFMIFSLSSLTMCRSGAGHSFYCRQNINSVKYFYKIYKKLCNK